MLRRFSLIALLVLICTLFTGASTREVRAADAPVEVRNAAYTHTINNNTWGSITVGINAQAKFVNYGRTFYTMRTYSACRITSPYGSGGVPYMLKLSSVAGTVRLDHHQKLTCDYEIFTTPRLNYGDISTPVTVPSGNSSTTCRVYGEWGAGYYRQQYIYTASVSWFGWEPMQPMDKMFCTTNVSYPGGLYYFNFNYENKKDWAF